MTRWTRRKGPIVGAALALLVGVGRGAPPSASPFPSTEEAAARREARWEELWREGKTLEEIEAILAREEEARGDAVDTPAGFGVDPALGDEIAENAPPAYRPAVPAFLEAWRAKVERRDVEALRDLVLSSIVRFKPEAGTKKAWLARAGLDEARLRAWIVSKLQCQALLAGRGSPAAAAAARAHLTAAEDCPVCRRRSPRLLEACLESYLAISPDPWDAPDAAADGTGAAGR